MSRNISMVINTSGLAYDDRLRKECGSLARLGARPSILALERANRESSGRTDEDIPFKTITLATRGLLPHRGGLGIKLAEMYGLFATRILHQRPEVLWVHDPEMAGLVPFGAMLRRLGVIQRLVWDQHELPPQTVLSRPTTKRILTGMMLSCDAVVVANNERRDLLTETLGSALKSRFQVLDNFSDDRFNELVSSGPPPELTTWLAERPYLLAQGGANPKRHLASLVEAVLRLDDVALVVVGPFQEDERQQLAHRFGPAFEQRVRFEGLVPQMELVNFIDTALASIVLYDHDQPNSNLCAPNRLYQALSRGTPGVVGCNPPMARVVSEFGCGVVLEGDGRDPSDLQRSLATFLASSTIFKAAAQANRRAFRWENQDTAVSAAAGLDGP